MDFRNKKVLIFGLGQYPEGSGVSAARFFISQGAPVMVTDMKSAEALAVTVKMIEGGVTLHLDGHQMEDVRWADLIIRNPGVPTSSPYLAEARQRGIPIMTDVSVFMKLCPCPILGVTGTRGKSTTTALLAEMVRLENKKTFVGGNIQRSPLTFLDKLDENSIVVLELSSWLLESLADIKQSPRGAIVTNIYPDHLNVHGTMKAYVAAKENIFRFQKPGDIVVLNRDNSYTKQMERYVPKGVNINWFSKKKNNRGASLQKDWVIVNGKKVVAVSQIKLKGEHNIANALAATALASAVGVSNTKIAQALKRFSGLSNRQEIIRIQKGVTWINDTTATTPEATMAALERFGSKKKNIVLIGGGTDKKLEFKTLATAIKKYCKAAVLFDGTATQKLRRQLGKSFPVIGSYTSMAEAITAARTIAVVGDIILLSPGATSFGIFKNEFDRGDQFVTLVCQLK